MTATNVKWMWWGGIALVIAYDMVVGIPSRVFMSILMVAVFWILHDLNKRLEALELESTERSDGLTERLDKLNKRLRWIEFKFFGSDCDDMLSEEWSARNKATEYEP
jgi:hypothetical protein